ncbi:MAG: ATP-binding protein [Spirochaetaceae bacterium]|jgi:predicted kinase|nr:ATP-binding protein [Spirochaetaceae bacterium]
MNNIFALCGKIGSGKSYVANEIVKYYKSIIFSADKIMLKLFGEIDGRELFENKFNICKEIIYEISDNILENTNGNIIFDFGFWAKNDRKILKERFNKYNVIFVYINTDNNICWERVEKRNKENNPNNYVFDKETFEYLSKLFENFSEDEEYIIFENMEKLKIEIDKKYTK